MAWVFPKIGIPQKWMVKIMENPIKMDDLGVPLFLETPIYTNIPFMEPNTKEENHLPNFFGRGYAAMIVSSSVKS